MSGLGLLRVSNLYSRVRVSLGLLRFTVLFVLLIINETVCVVV